MHYGLVMECDYRYGTTQEDAFQEAFTLVDAAETGGLDGVWLAERHFAAPRNPLDGMGAGIPSIVSAPLIMASAIAARTERLRVGIAVSVLPLNHPVRMAEEVATIDHVSRGRFDFGVGRSGFARSYEGYGIPYEESRERFEECLQVILAAWTNERFSHHGKYYSMDNVAVLPQPYQKPYPPIRVAATTQDSFPRIGGQGRNVFVGLRGLDRPDLARNLKVYRDAWKEGGHDGDGMCSCAYRSSWARPTKKHLPRRKRAPCAAIAVWPSPSPVRPLGVEPPFRKSGRSAADDWRKSLTKICCGTDWPTAAPTRLWRN